MKTKLVDLCPHCRQPMPKDATTPDPRSTVTIMCDMVGCHERASFIQDRRALCFAHTELPPLARVMNNFFNKHKVRHGA